ncbi:MAG: hypothetical protein AVDCRST_MAG72-1850 [uncultured Nocardioidaceae bacterium]|uniref:N-acetyltransferase domain-containing protein n=1 Tax=uncultured Nocardioidaceae bacterium TaxID=253824 RepID=A0A6J4MFR8_9ACTN|nr:MAG: hypothetical protein AVDCRST_MAG72-1850 [uncultured Nocardioidaceae bacterium]
MIVLATDPSVPVRSRSRLPAGWTVCAPEADDTAELTALVRRHEEWARGWASSSEADVLVEISETGRSNRHNVVLCDRDGRARGWANAYDRASGRMVLTVVVDPRLDDSLADRTAEVLLEWAEEAAGKVGAGRRLTTQQIDTGAFADDTRQQRWLTTAGFEMMRRWWQMSRPVRTEDAAVPPLRPGVRIRLVERAGNGMPDEDDLRVVHDILEDAFVNHFNSHAETFDEFLARLREDPGHRWDHWWLAELVDGPTPQPVGTLVGSLVGAAGGDGSWTPTGSYVSYIGVLESARGRGVAKSLLSTIIADAAARGLGEVGLEVDADSPTGAEGLYLSMGWQTKYVTQSWHRDVPVPRQG